VRAPGDRIFVGLTEDNLDQMMRPALILVYHGIAKVSQQVDPRNLVVDPERFAAQVEVLKRRDYEFVTVSEFVARLGFNAPSSRLCALTFDDGTVDHAGTLPELLERLDVPATLYVCPGLLGRPNPFLQSGNPLRFMTAEELRGASQNPRIEIGSHTRTHVVLEDATEEEAYTEMVASKADLEALIDKPVLTFAYPRCFYSSACPAAAERAGYLAAVTCGPRGSWNPYELRRQAMASFDGRVAFELKSRAWWYPLQQSHAGRALPWAVKLLRRSRPTPAS
jgi:peptidoglycan/xylan/chitin deacetylase (PgdA/CDA1 family)